MLICYLCNQTKGCIHKLTAMGVFSSCYRQSLGGYLNNCSLFSVNCFIICQHLSFTCVSLSVTPLQVSSAVERLMLQHTVECQEDTWRALWIVPILEMLSHASPSVCGPLQALLATAMSHHPGLVTHILLPITSDMCAKATHLCTVLRCICLARKQGALDDQSKFQHCSSLWKGVFDLRVLEQALYHHDVEVSSCATYGIISKRKCLFSSARYFNKYCIYWSIVEEINHMDFTFAVHLFDDSLNHVLEVLQCSLSLA